MADDSNQLRQRLVRRLSDLKSVRSAYESHWRQLADYIRPDRLRIEETLSNADPKSARPDRSKIKDAAATKALRTLASGMHSGITSPSRPWFRLTTIDPNFRESAAVRDYLGKVATIMRDVFSQSNFYNSVHLSYGDLGLFGQSCAILAEHDKDVINLIGLVHGQFWIATDDAGRVNTLYRYIPMTVEQVYTRWTKTCSDSIKHQMLHGNKDARVAIYQAIEPRVARNPAKIDKQNMAFMSVYWEDGAPGSGSTSGILEESGFIDNPIVAPRWEVISTDSYGIGPGTDALPDVKSLQLERTRYLEAVDKLVRPPMKGPLSLKNARASLLPGKITYVDDPNGQGFTPAMQVQIRLVELQGEMTEMRESIKETFFADLFLMISQMEGIQPRNQFEIAERKEEKLLMLGPVLERIQAELLAPIIERTYEICRRRGLFPPEPDEIQQGGLQVEYTSILAQAQKAVATGAIERTASFVGGLAAMYPSVGDKFDADQAVDEYSELLGTPPAIILSDERVAEIRKGREAEAAQQKQMEQAAAMAPVAKQGAEAAKLMAETPTVSPNNTAASLLQRMGIG
jgi:hypothetical protein